MNKLLAVTRSDQVISYLTLISGLSISAVAVYYSVAGLVSIFAAAAIPIMVMGVVLEISKLVATVWLKQYWTIAPRAIKTYLFISVVILMLITSMGIFGYLSKAHLDQNMVSGDVVSKVAILDEKIKTQKENIDAARRALAQMDAAVDQTLSRTNSEQGADKAAALRRQQARERGNLQNDIAKAQTEIGRLQAERAPIASELRKVEAEVGPIKYIAALIYGDNPDQNTLERAVRWVIIMIVIIFDPLAVALLLASQYSFGWFREAKDNPTVEEDNWPEPEPTDYKHGEWPFPVDEEPLEELEVSEEPAKVNPKEEFEQAAEQRRLDIAERKAKPSVLAKAWARRQKVETREQKEQAKTIAAAPPGTPGEAWITAPTETAEQPLDDLDKVYREASAVEARKKRSRGWLQSTFPTQDD